MTIFWCPPGVYQPPSTFWSVTLQPIGADQATIWHMKGDIHSYHMRYNSMICPQRLQRNEGLKGPRQLPLVVQIHSYTYVKGQLCISSI